MLVLLAGVVMLVTPGPAFVVIPLGLAILATQFRWARRLLRHFRERAAVLVSSANVVRDAAKPNSAEQDDRPIRDGKTAAAPLDSERSAAR